MKREQLDKFRNLDFNDFRKMATDPGLTDHERVGFPNSYREGFEEKIFADICGKLPLLSERGKRVLDIGPGCSVIPRMLTRLCRERGHELILLDSAEMLGRLPDDDCLRKVPAQFPDGCPAFIEENRGSVDVILTYSVFHYIYTDGNVFRFLDASLSLLAHGGEMLVGDIPNVSKRKRFFSSPQGIAFHQEFMGTEDPPEVHFNTIEAGNIDDGVLLGLVARCRLSGADAYLVPQPAELPMANRREDILIRKA